MSGAICNGSPSRWERRCIRCPYCKRRRRFLTRLLFDGYVSECACGGCGAVGDSEEIRRTGKREAARVMAMVREEWPLAVGGCR